MLENSKAMSNTIAQNTSWHIQTAGFVSQQSKTQILYIQFNINDRIFGIFACCQ